MEYILQSKSNPYNTSNKNVVERNVTLNKWCTYKKTYLASNWCRYKQIEIGNISVFNL